MQVKLSASLMCADLCNLERDIKQLEQAGVDFLHFDIMDGHFVPNFTLGPEIIRRVKKITNIPVDTHLMIERPENFISTFIEAGSDLISVHIEATPHIHRVVSEIRRAGALPGVAVNPSTSLSQIEYILEEVSFVLVMTVNPGFAGQVLIPATIAKIGHLKRLLQKRRLDKNIEVDGNVSFTHAPRMVEQGANILACGTSSIFDPRLSIPEAVEKLRKATLAKL